MLRKYWTIFTIGISERLTYRTDFLFGTLMRFMPMVTTIYLWSAIFAGSSETQIAGLTRSEMIAYYLLTMVGRAFSSMPGLAHGIAGDIRTGNIKKYLTQPIDMIGFLLVMRVAHKLVYYAIAAIPFAIVFILCRGYFSGWPEPGILLAFIYACLLSFLIGFLFEALVGMLAFWVLEISSFSFIIITLNYLLSGHMFPLDLIPGTAGTIVRWLPFQYLAYFPAILFLHGSEWTGTELAIRLGEATAYALVLLAAVQIVYRKGVRRYSAFGG